MKKKKIFIFKIIISENKDAKDSLNLIIKRLYNKFDNKKLETDIRPYLYIKYFKYFPQYFFLYFLSDNQVILKK